MIVSSFPEMNAGLKNGNPWMWSQWRWEIIRYALIDSPFSMSRSPRFLIPVPASRMISSSLASLNSTHGVFPPYPTVCFPGVEIDPRVPQNVRRIVGRVTSSLRSFQISGGCPTCPLPFHKLDPDISDQHLHLCDDRNPRRIVAEPPFECSGQPEDSDEVCVAFKVNEVDRIVDCIDLFLLPLPRESDDRCPFLLVHKRRYHHRPVRHQILPCKKQKR